MLNSGVRCQNRIRRSLENELDAELAKDFPKGQDLRIVRITSVCMMVGNVGANSRALIVSIGKDLMLTLEL